MKHGWKKQEQEKKKMRFPIEATPLQSIAPLLSPMITSYVGNSRPILPLLSAPMAPTFLIKKFSLQELREKREKGHMLQLRQNGLFGINVTLEF